MKPLTYGQLAHGLTLQEFEPEVAGALRSYGTVLNWQTKSNARLTKRLFGQGYSVSDVASHVLLNSK